MSEQESGRRFVHKREYYWIQGKRLGLTLIAVFVCLLGILSPLWVMWHRYHLGSGLKMRTAMYLVTTCPILLIFMLRILAKSRYFLMQARQIDPGILITRANTADIPADESLVRPSSQSKTSDKANALLLRASAETQEKHEEQVLRASVGQE